MPTPSSYRAPGVYVEWLDVNSQLLEPGRTDIAGFIGIAERGPAHCPQKIESSRQFASTFGNPIAQGYLAYAVDGFFSNGGRTCWVVRAADPLAALPARIRLSVGGRQPFVLEATSPGSWGNQIRVQSVWGRDQIELLTVTTGGAQSPSAAATTSPPQSQTVYLGADGQPQPEPSSMTLLGVPESSLPEFATEQLVQAKADDATLPLSPLGPSVPTALLSGGTDGVKTLKLEHFTGDPASTRPLGMDALARIDGISFVAAPDLMFAADPSAALEFSGFGPATVRDAQIKLLTSCKQRRDRMLLIDLPCVRLPDALDAVGTSPALGSPLTRTSYGAVYYPWIIVDDPLQLTGSVRTIPPSGHVAGIFARADRLRGVHKPPANEVLEGVWDLYEQIDDAAHADLNDASINAIRALPGRGVLVLGARTLDTDLRWRYINIRRLFAMIEESLEEQLQWLTFEPNSPRLWKEIDRAVRGFLERLFRAGMLDGNSSDDAYYVRCDETTNPESDTDAGRVICQIGLQPPWPAEFVIVRIGVTRSGIEIEEKGAQDV
jgi:phage tail sheath protein FI